MPSFSLPANDPTLLFVNSGMVQFKDVPRQGPARLQARHHRASAACAPAAAAPGNVGYTARHHVLRISGSFSFGDYFKKDAIHFAWDLLQGVQAAEALGDGLSTDDQAYGHWTKLSAPAAQPRGAHQRQG